jgi:HNH endonuclease
VSDRRYSTAKWQSTRKAVLRRDGHQCRIGGPGCLGTATTVHHVYPSSTHPHLFWSSENLISACSRCNYSGGARIAATNRRSKVERLEEIIRSQDQRIRELVERVMELEAERPQHAIRSTPPKPAIF